ncbi:HAD family hydrolase [Haloferacaceae archaeon DSL9]
MCYDALVFDNDGVLTHPTSSDILHRGVEDAFAAFDVEPSIETIESIVGGDVSSIKRACAEHDLDPDAFWTQREASVAAAQRTALEDGTKPLYDDFDSLYDLEAPLAVVSNNQHETIESIVDVFGLDELFRYVSGREPTIDGFKRRKPEPAYLTRAIDSLAVDSALYVGDSNVDILAADRAGMDVAFIRRPHRADYSLVAEPTYEIDSLADLRSIAV